MAFTRITRTIESPGVEIFETDLSNRVNQPAGTKIYTMGFADEGPTDEVIQITSTADFESIYGTPKNAAERYFYHTVKGALNSPGTIYCNRLPYGSGTGQGFGSQYSVLAFPVTAYNTTTSGFSNTMDLSAAVYFVGKPTQFALNEDQYQQLINGTMFTWSATASSTFSTTTDLASAGLLVINKAQTIIDPQYNGYYIALGDNVDVDNISNDYTKVTFAYTVANSATRTAVFTTIPESVLTFSLSSASTSNIASISRILETQTTTYIMNSSEFADHLLVNTYKLRKVFGNDDPRKLTFVLDTKYAGSIDSFRTVTSQTSVGAPAFLETVSNDTNYQILVNPYVSNKNGTTGGRTSLVDLVATKKIRVLNETLVTKLSADIGAPTSAVTAAAAAVGKCNGIFPLGVYSDQKLTGKLVGDVASKAEKALEKVRNKDLFDLDIFVEGGLGTIHTYTQLVPNEMFIDTAYPTALATKVQAISSSAPTDTDIVTYYDGVLTKFSSFCNSMQEGGRGDVFFIADPLRWIFVEGKNLKTMTKPNVAFSTQIYYPMRNLYDQYNTNYGAVYADWFRVTDSTLGEDVWVPSSGFIAGKFAVNDALVGPWGAPAGFNRGIINNVVDLAFSPNQKQRDDLYKASFNPVVQFPGQGIAIFGQKTLQKKPSAFDRVNVRRLFLYCEKAVYKALQYFVFENNTDFTRRRVVNTLNPFFERIKSADGLYDFKVVCSSANNTAEVIDNNELIISIYMKPVRTAEYILANFIATRTDVNFEELIG